MQMNMFRGNFGVVRGLLIQFIDQHRRHRCLVANAIKLKTVAAIFDLNAQALFDLPQVLVKLSAEAGKPARIVGF